jgi:prepilin-type N-terminal cleavage/methylation domain-containing protein
MTDESKGSRGLTLLELIVTMAIISIILSLAVPRYLGFRRNALVAEADTLLAEVKTLAWVYYQQHGTWVGITTATMPAALGFEAPAGACWAFDVVGAGTEAQIQFRATGVSPPVKCLPAQGGTVTLTLNSDGSSERTQAFP